MYKPHKLFWDEKFSTGDPALDFQHKYMFETFNKLSDAIAAAQGNESVSVILGRLKFYSDWHFKKEEECFNLHQCPSAKTNIDAHANFRELLAAYSEDYEKTGGSQELAIRIHESLADWLTRHILVVDTTLRACIHKKEQD